MRSVRSRWLAVAAGLVLLVGCGSATGSAPASDQVIVVASTNVWGDIARQIGGPHVAITSLISDPDADPHSYEANTQNQLAVSKAALIIENGGGYDDFVDTEISTTKSRAVVINAVTTSGHPSGDTLNEHVWYDFPTVARVAEQLREDLTRADPAHAGDYQTATGIFAAKIRELEAKEAAIKAKHSGVGVAITEPVPLYLLQASGLVNKTPEKFSAAIEGDSDVPADVLADTLKLFSGKQVRALVYNEQTTGPQTAAVLKAAKDNSIAVVPVTETLPTGLDYITWMSGNVDAVAAAVA